MKGRVWEDCKHGRWLSPCPLCQKEKVRRLADIDQKIRQLEIAAMAEEITCSQAREEIDKLQAERERLWQG